MSCVCGHPEHDHGPSGKCRVPDCPCEQFQPGYTIGTRARSAARRVVGRGAVSPGGEARSPRNADSPLSVRRIVLTLVLALIGGPGLSLADAAEPPTIPASFAEVAGAALAASFVIRASGPDTVVEDGLSIQSALDADDDIQEDGWEPLDPVAALRNRTLGAGVIIDPRGIALTSTRVMLRASAFEVVLMDGTPVNATVVGLDLRSDVTVLRLESHGGFFPHLPLGDSERVQVGDWVISVGAPLGLEGTVAAGVVTATPMPASPSPFGSYLRRDPVARLMPIQSLLGAIERAVTKDAEDLSEEGQTADVRERVEWCAWADRAGVSVPVGFASKTRLASEIGDLPQNARRSRGWWHCP